MVMEPNTQLRKKLIVIENFNWDYKLAEDSTWILPGVDKLIQKLNDNLLIDDVGLLEKNVTWEEYNFYDNDALTLLSMKKRRKKYGI